MAHTQSDRTREAIRLDAITNPMAYRFGKVCATCGVPLANRFKVRTCQACRHEEYMAHRERNR